MKIVKTTFVQKIKIQECENGMVCVTVPPNQPFYLTVNEENGSGMIYPFLKRNLKIAKNSLSAEWKDMF
jgi:hypothetical protein